MSGVHFDFATIRRHLPRPVALKAALVMFGASSILGIGAFAQTESSRVAEQVLLVNFIQDTATKICPVPSGKASRHLTEIKEVVTRETNGLFVKAKQQSNATNLSYTTEGVAQTQLATLIEQSNTCRLSALYFLSDKLLGGPPPKVIADRVIPPSTPVVAVRSHTVAAAALRPSNPNDLVVRVFPKANLTAREAILLAKELPTFNVKLGKSDIDPSNYTDTLFVNRDKVTPAEVLEVIRALAALGIHIKSIQQYVIGGRREIQVGTIGDSTKGGQVFADMTPLDLASLENSTGAEFWKRGYNGGPVFCPAGIGHTNQCHMGLDSRPFE